MFDLELPFQPIHKALLRSFSPGCFGLQCLRNRWFSGIVLRRGTRGRSANGLLRAPRVIHFCALGSRRHVVWGLCKATGELTFKCRWKGGWGSRLPGALAVTIKEQSPIGGVAAWSLARNEGLKLFRERDGKHRSEGKRGLLQFKLSFSFCSLLFFLPSSCRAGGRLWCVWASLQTHGYSDGSIPRKNITGECG